MNQQGDEHDFQQVVHDFRQAVGHLTDPMTVTTIQGHTATVDGLVHLVGLGMTHAHADIPTTSGYESRPPVWVAGVDWLAAVGAAVALVMRGTNRPTLTGPARGVADVLVWARDAPFSPADTQPLRVATRRLQGLRWSGLTLIYPELFTLDAPCPECGATTVKRGDRGGDVVTVPALSVHELWAQCAACTATWWGADIVEGLAACLANENTPAPTEVG